MPMRRSIRAALAVALLLSAGCVAAPPVVGPGQVLLSQQCYAGFYQCVLPSPNQVGAPCSCPGLGAPSYGTVR